MILYNIMLITAITVSTKYADILKLILPVNARFFHKWYIVTSKNDVETIRVIREFQETQPTTDIEIIYFDFYTNAVFNKGGAIQYAQYVIQDTIQDTAVLLLDSDICLPENFDKIMDNVNLQEDTIYGAAERRHFFTKAHFETQTVDKQDVEKTEFLLGYFQLYYYKTCYLYQPSGNCSDCDLEFANLFPNREVIPGLYVGHLGKENENWNGRLTTNAFV